MDEDRGDSDMEHAKGGVEWVYKAVNRNVTSTTTSDGGIDALSEVPCGKCPVSCSSMSASHNVDDNSFTNLCVLGFQILYCRRSYLALQLRVLSQMAKLLGLPLTTTQPQNVYNTCQGEIHVCI
jgi:hypothetical protein